MRYFCYSLVCYILSAVFYILTKKFSGDNERLFLHHLLALLTILALGVSIGMMLVFCITIMKMIGW